MEIKNKTKIALILQEILWIKHKLTSFFEQLDQME